MKWSLIELAKYRTEPLQIESTLDLEASLKKRNQEIIKVAPVKVNGTLSVSKEEYIVHLHLQTVFTIPSSRSLEPVELSIERDISEIYMTPQRFAEKGHEDLKEEDIAILEEEQLDLLPAIEDYLLLSIPLQTLTDEEQHSDKMPKGAFWEVVSEEEYEKRKSLEANSKIDPRLAKLSELQLDAENTDDT